MADASNLFSHYYVKISGADAPAALMGDLAAVTVESSLHLPDVATLVLEDAGLDWIDDDLLLPGASVQISAKDEQAEIEVFDGEVVELEPDFGAGTQRLLVRAFDRLHRLARGCFVRSFQNVTDSDLVERIGQEVGLKAQVGATPQVHPYVLQANETNLAFLQRRAAALGYLLFVDGDTLHCEAPSMNGAEQALTWNEGLLEFRPRLTTIDQVSEVTVRGWDPEAKRSLVGQAGSGNGSPDVGERRAGGALVEHAFGLKAPCLVADRPVRTQAEADRLAQAVADQRASMYIEAEGRSSGMPALRAGTTAAISAVGDRFSGHYLVTGAAHHFTDADGYTTSFTVSGLNAPTLTRLLAAPVPEPALGLVVGLVTDNNDPAGQGRVKVKYPWLSDEHASHWARVVAPGGGAARGVQFLPEVNDEVLVGFERGDVHHPYVLGGLWNGQDAPPERSSEAVQAGTVQRRIIRSRTGHRIVLDDSEGGGVTIEDKNGNTVALNAAENALTVEVAGDVQIAAQGNLSLKAQGRVEIEGGTDVKVQGGTTVDVKASTINLN